jgi:REP-associated tyrosine transposase
MPTRKIYDGNLDAHFITFSCYKRRNYLDDERARRIVVSILNTELAKRDGRCFGFVVMPNHVHTLIWFSEEGHVGSFMRVWKQRTSVKLKSFLKERKDSYTRHLNPTDPIWQPRYYDFNVQTQKKVDEKLDYMHVNPVRAGLVERAVMWTTSSARYYLEDVPVGIPLGMGTGD